jgi:hypothetical protein
VLGPLNAKKGLACGRDSCCCRCCCSLHVACSSSALQSNGILAIYVVLTFKAEIAGGLVLAWPHHDTSPQALLLSTSPAFCLGSQGSAFIRQTTNRSPQHYYVCLLPKKKLNGTTASLLLPPTVFLLYLCLV